MLVTDLYSDNNKTLSAGIQGVLEGGNASGLDYTLNVSWKLDESDKTTKKIDSVSVSLFLKLS